MFYTRYANSDSAGYCTGGIVGSYDSTGKLKEREWGRNVINSGRAAHLNDFSNVRGYLLTEND